MWDYAHSTWYIHIVIAKWESHFNIISHTYYISSNSCVTLVIGTLSGLSNDIIVKTLRAKSTSLGNPDTRDLTILSHSLPPPLLTASPGSLGRWKVGRVDVAFDGGREGVKDCEACGGWRCGAVREWARGWGGGTLEDVGGAKEEEEEEEVAEWKKSGSFSYASNFDKNLWKWAKSTLYSNNL